MTEPSSPKRRAKYQRRTPGAILRIDLGDGYFAFAQILYAGLAFFDLRTKEREIDLNLLDHTPVLFIVEVYNDVISRMRWPKVGKLPIRSDLQTPPLEYIRDAMNPDRFELYEPLSGKITPATREECNGLEVAAVWEAEHVEQRLRDRFAGRPNRDEVEDQSPFVDV